MCMIGQLQWEATLGRYDILAHVMSMSRFSLAPKVGCLERLKRLYGCLSKKLLRFAIMYRTQLLLSTNTIGLEQSTEMSKKKFHKTFPKR